MMLSVRSAAWVLAVLATSWSFAPHSAEAQCHFVSRGTLFGSDSDTGEQLGKSASADGGFVAFGSPDWNSGRGAFTVFRRESGSGAEQQRFENVSGDPDDSFGMIGRASR